MRDRYVGGNLFLDFTNTVSSRLSARRADSIATYRELLDWAVGAGVLATERERELTRLAASMPRDAEATVRRARRMREALYKISEALIQGDQVMPREIEIVNSILREGQSALVIEPTASAYRWAWRPLKPDLSEPLWPIARSLADFLADGDPRRLRRCDDSECGWLFLDSSRNRSRRWCSMADCGSRNKQRLYYRRQQSRRPPAR